MSREEILEMENRVSILRDKIALMIQNRDNLDLTEPEL